MEVQTLYGLRIVESPVIGPVPRMQVSKAFSEVQSPELVASTNAWMKEFFGMYEPVYLLNGDSIAMSPKRAAMLRLNLRGLI